MSKRMKRFLSFALAFAMIVTTVCTSEVMTAYAASSSKTVKSVTLKIGKTNVTKKTTKMYVGKSATLAVSVSPSTAKKKVTYKSSKATVATVSSKGKIAAKKAGTSKITVTVVGKDNKKKTTYVNVKVSNVAVSSVKLSKTTAGLIVGKSLTLKATVAPSNATVKTVKWTTSDKSVATVSSKGVVKAVAGGKAVITAKSGTKSAKCTVTVTQPVANVPVTGIAMSQETKELALSATTSLTATVAPENATNKSIVWASKDPSIVTVDQNGNIKGIKTGRTTITATTADGGFEASCSVLVTGTSSKNAAKVTVDIANSLADYDKTVLTGTDADVRVRVLDEDGNPVGNTEVTLNATCNNLGNGAGIFEIKNDDVAKTDADGYVDFVFGEKSSYSYTSTDPYFESYLLKATVVGSSVYGASALSFGFIEMDGTIVENNRNLTHDDDITPSDNATAYDDGISNTMEINGCRDKEYVNSQQVSKNDTTEHAVTFSASPYLVIPSTTGDTSVDKYYLDVNESSTEYSVYNDIDNEATTKTIKGVPAGLQYATLNFSKVTLSEYTRINIETYNSVTGALIQSYQMYKDSNTTEIKPTASYQLPIQKDVAIDVVVSIDSEGQVNDDCNDGYTIRDITGLWSSTSGKAGQHIELKDSVKWNKVDTVYSNLVDISLDEVRNYIPADSKYLNEKYTYKYEVPTFPYTGDAVITVNDENKGVVAYYLYPTINKYEWERNNSTNILEKVYKNLNIIPDPVNYNTEYPGKVGILASSEEINYATSVGEIAQTGNNVTVNSYVSGVTGLKATVTLPQLTSNQLNATNGSILYTSVQWAPTPNDIDKSDDFYALLGQQVTVTAQLLDTNGNAKKESGSTIDFTYGDIQDGTKIKSTDIGNVLGSTGVTLINGTKLTTDENGQAKLVLKSSDYSKFITYIKAKSEKYNVELKIGDQITKLANAYWIDAGLKFTDKVSTEKVASKSWKSYTNNNVTLENKDIDDRNVGTNWIFGYEVIGRAGLNNIIVEDITNIPVDITKDSLGAISTENCANGEAKLYSEKVGTTNLTGTISNETFDETKVPEFTIWKNDEVKVYKNVGTGTPTIKSSMTIPISWKTAGVKLSVVSPLGTALDKNTSTHAYIYASDNYGNPIKDREISYTITGLNSKATTTAYTNSDGLVDINLATPSSTWTEENYTTTISASTDDDQIVAEPLTLQYSKSTATKFALVGAAYDTVNSTADNDVVELTFSVPVKSINKDLIGIKSGNTTYKVLSADISATDSRKVLVKLEQNAIGKFSETTKVDVTIVSEITDAVNGMVYKAIDQNGVTLMSDYMTTSFDRPADYKITAEYVNGKINVSVKNGNSDVIVNGKDIIAVADVASVFKNASNEAVGVVSGTGTGVNSVSLKANPTDKDSTVRVYYRGVMKEVTVKAATN